MEPRHTGRQAEQDGRDEVQKTQAPGALSQVFERLVVERRVRGESAQHAARERESKRRRDHFGRERDMHQRAHEERSEHVHGERPPGESGAEEKKGPPRKQIPHTGSNGAPRANPQEAADRLAQARGLFPESSIRAGLPARPVDSMGTQRRGIPCCVTVVSSLLP